MTDTWFYHLERTSLEQALPELLEKVVARGWRAYVHCCDSAGSSGDRGSHEDDKIRALDAHLWAYAPETFMAHGREGGDFDARQPVLLGGGATMANQPDVYVSVVPADMPDVEGMQRCLLIFEGSAPDHVAWARRQWSLLKAKGHGLAYWKQNENGRWEKAQ